MFKRKQVLIFAEILPTLEFIRSCIDSSITRDQLETCKRMIDNFMDAHTGKTDAKSRVTKWIILSRAKIRIKLERIAGNHNPETAVDQVLDEIQQS